MAGVGGSREDGESYDLRRNIFLMVEWTARYKQVVQQVPRWLKVTQFR